VGGGRGRGQARAGARCAGLGASIQPGHLAGASGASREPRAFPPRRSGSTLPEIVHACPPSRSRRAPVGIDTSLVVVAHEHPRRVLGELRRRPPRVVVRPAPWIHEHRPPVTVPQDPPSALVHEPVVMTAQEHRVPQARPPAVRPVPHVMRVAEAEAAAREATTPVPGLEGAAQRGRDRARSPAHVEHRAVGAVRDPDQPRVAGDPAGRFRGAERPYCVGSSSRLVRETFERSEKKRVCRRRGRSGRAEPSRLRAPRRRGPHIRRAPPRLQYPPPGAPPRPRAALPDSAPHGCR
jgi:hypothetical protein